MKLLGRQITLDMKLIGMYVGQQTSIQGRHLIRFLVGLLTRLVQIYVTYVLHAIYYSNILDNLN